MVSVPLRTRLVRGMQDFGRQPAYPCVGRTELDGSGGPGPGYGPEPCVARTSATDWPRNRAWHAGGTVRGWSRPGDGRNGARRPARIGLDSAASDIAPEVSLAEGVRPPHHAARARRRSPDRHPASRNLGRGAGEGGRGTAGGGRGARPQGVRASSAAASRPTRSTTRRRSSSGPSSAATTSTAATAPDTPPLSPVWRPCSALVAEPAHIVRPKRRTSSSCGARTPGRRIRSSSTTS